MTRSDSIPRIQLPDIFLILKDFEYEDVRTLDDLRLKICTNRKKSPAGDRYWPTTRDVAVELQRLEFITTGSFPKDQKAYDSMRHNKLKITEVGRGMLNRFNQERAVAYDELFCRMYAIHPYLRMFVKELNQGPLYIPVVTSAKEHISERYSSATSLTDDVSRRVLDTESLCENLSRRLRRDLTAAEKTQINEGAWRLLEQWANAAALEEPSVFAKKFLQKINDIVLPAVLGSEKLGFDFKTHERLWSFGKEWRLWDTTVSHPDWDLRIAFKTATVKPSIDGNGIDKLIFDSGIETIRSRFLEKLFAAYQKLQSRGRGTFAVVDEIKALFCVDNACQQSVFDRVLGEFYVGSEEYELNMAIYRRGRQKGRPIRIGNRNIGLIRVIRRDNSHAAGISGTNV